jgi:alpha-galactosidase
MGWNSWDCYGLTVNESTLLASALVAQQQLLRHGWEYLVVDAGWYAAPGTVVFSTDGHGRVIPDTTLWPSSVGGVGFAPVTAKLHAQGLKFGIHVMRGVSASAVERKEPILGTSYTVADIAVPADACVWWASWFGVNASHPATQAYYDSVFSLYAQWGVDYVKVDCIFGMRDEHAADIAAISNAVARSGHPMLLSLSPGKDATPAEAQPIAPLVNMYRITDDLWDCWNASAPSPHCVHRAVRWSG